MFSFPKKKKLRFSKLYKRDLNTQCHHKEWKLGPTSLRKIWEKEPQNNNKTLVSLFFFWVNCKSNVLIIYGYYRLHGNFLNEKVYFSQASIFQLKQSNHVYLIPNHSLIWIMNSSFPVLMYGLNYCISLARGKRISVVG